MNGLRHFTPHGLASVQYSDDLNQDAFTIAWKGKALIMGSMWQEGSFFDRGYNNDYRAIAWDKYIRLQLHLSDGTVAFVEYDGKIYTDFDEGWFIFTYDGNGNIQLYYNSTLLTTGTVSPTTILHGTTTAQIWPINGKKWDGVEYTKAIGFWNRVLTSHEIDDLVSGKIPVDPILYFDFEKDQFNPVDYGTGEHSVYVNDWLVNQSERVEASSR